MKARSALLACIVVSAACSAFNGPANPPNAPWPVVCDGGGRCPAEHECAAGGTCKWVGGVFGASPDGGLHPTVQQRRGAP